MDEHITPGSSLALYQDRDGQYVTIHPVYLLWQDSFNVAQMIFGSPIFQHDMCYDPHVVFTGSNNHEYGEWMSSQEATRIQVSNVWSSLFFSAHHTSGRASCWSHNCTYHSCFQQNTCFKTDWEPWDASIVPYNQEYLLGSVDEGNHSCVVMHCIHALRSICCAQRLYSCPSSEALALLHGHHMQLLKESGCSGYLHGWSHQCRALSSSRLVIWVSKAF